MAFEFHKEREQHRERFTSPTKNKMIYLEKSFSSGGLMAFRESKKLRLLKEKIRVVVRNMKTRKHIKSFFNSCDCYTPDDYNPADYFLTVTNDDFDEKNKNPQWWAKAFLEWNEKKANRRASDDSLQSMQCSMRGSMRSSRRGSILINIDPIEALRENFFHQVTELVRQYFTNLTLNPGILGLRVVMYAMLALIIGAVFWKIGK